jgi:hypothetical protein
MCVYVMCPSYCMPAATSSVLSLQSVSLYLPVIPFYRQSSFSLVHISPPLPTGVQTKSAVAAAMYWPIIPALDDNDDCGAISGMNEWQGKPKYSEETCPSAAMSTTDPT